MEKIQELFDKNRTGDVTFVPGEYEGPLTVDRPCIINGAGSTLWAEKGPVLIITSGGVTVKDLRIEVTGGGSDLKERAAVRSDDPSAQLINVEVNGSVTGLSCESENWELPAVIGLGEFAADEENTYTIDLSAAADAELFCEMQDLHIYPDRISAGENKLILTTGRLRDNTILYGSIMVKTAVARRIYVMGRSVQGAPVHRDNAASVRLREYSSVIAPPVPAADPEVSQTVIPEEKSTSSAHASHVPDVKYPKRGQRVSAGEIMSETIRISYEHKYSFVPLEVDGYCFLLSENNKVSCDEDLIFFGNTQAADASVEAVTEGADQGIIVRTGNAAASVSKIAVCFSVYGDDPKANFSAAVSPVIRIFGGNNEVFRFELNDLADVKTLVAVEIYRYKGDWRINFVGSGYMQGIRHLCESYGVEVE